MHYEDMFFDDETYWEKKKISKQYLRNPELARDVIKKFDFKCFLDKTHLTFETEKMKNYVEAHHIIPMAFSHSFSFNLDVETNIIPLCPNCHRKMHLATSNTQIEMLKQIYRKYQSLQNLISIEMLENLYIN